MIDSGDRWDQFLKGFLIRLYGFKNEMCFSLEIVFLDILLFLSFDSHLTINLFKKLHEVNNFN